MPILLAKTTMTLNLTICLNNAGNARLVDKVFVFVCVSDRGPLHRINHG